MTVVDRYVEVVKLLGNPELTEIEEDDLLTEADQLWYDMSLEERVEAKGRVRD